MTDKDGIERRMNRGFVLLVAGLGIGICLGFILMANEHTRKQTVGQVLRSEVNTIDRQERGLGTERGRFDYEAVIAYEYEVGGKRYQSTRLYRRMPAIFSREDFALQIVARFPVGTTVDVHYDPADPALSCLLEMRLGAKMIVLLVGIILLVIAMFVVAFLASTGRLKLWAT